MRRSSVIALALAAVACDVSPLERVPRPDAPAAPQDLRVVAATSSSLDLAWRAVEGADGYRLTRDVAADGAFERVVYEGPAFSATDRGLAPAASWFYRVAAVGVGGVGVASAPVAGTTTATMSEDRVPPGRIDDFVVSTGLLEGELRARWTNPADEDLVGVAFRYRTDGVFPTGLDDGEALPSATATTATTWTGLDSDLAYAITGFAFDGVPNHAPGTPATAEGRPRSAGGEAEWRDANAATFNRGVTVDTRVVDPTDSVMLVSHPSPLVSRTELDIGEDVGDGPTMPHVLRVSSGGHRMYYAYDAGGHRQLAAKESQDGLTDWGPAVELGLGSAMEEATEPFAYSTGGNRIELYYTAGGDSRTTGRLMRTSSADGLTGWSTPTPVDVGYAVTGSAFLFDAIDGSTRLYFATFTDPSWDLGVAISTDDRATWTQARLLDPNAGRDRMWPWLVPLRDGAFRLYWGARRVGDVAQSMGALHRRTPDGLTQFENGVGAGAMLDVRGFSILPLDDGSFRFYFGERRDNGERLIVARSAASRFASFGSIEGVVRGGQNAGYQFKDLSWRATTPPGTRVTVQLRSGNDRTNLGLWRGPADGVPAYETSPAVPNPVHDGAKWIQYRVILETNDETLTPVLHEVSIGYTPL